jgi:hypothetical protein
MGSFEQDIFKRTGMLLAISLLKSIAQARIEALARGPQSVLPRRIRT